MLSPQLPSRFDPPCGAAQRFVPTVDSLPAQLLHGLQQPFFFLRGPTALVWLGRTKRTDFLIDSDQLLAEFLQAVKLGDFLLRFTESRRTGKSLGNGFAVDPAGEPNLGIVPGIILAAAYCVLIWPRVTRPIILLLAICVHGGIALALVLLIGACASDGATNKTQITTNEMTGFMTGLPF